MSDTTNPGSGAPGGAGGAGPSGDSSQNSNQNPNSSPKVVPWESHQRVLDDMHKFKTKVGELEQKLGSQESDRLKQANDFKTLYENEQKAHGETKKTLSDLKGWTVNTQRFQAVKEAAVGAGVRKEALKDLELLDASAVKVEVTSTGRFIVEGAKEFVEGVKSERPYWFNVGNPPTVNSGGGSGPGGAPPQGAQGGEGKTTLEMVVQAELDMKHRKIPRAKYVEIYNKYIKDNPRTALPANQSPR